MTVQTPDLPQTVRKPQHAVFFRQSGWLMIANIVGGAMTFGVHFLNKRIPDAEYSIFGMLLMVTAVLPTMPLQMVFAQQTASALATGRERQVAGMIRLAWLWLLALWLAGAAGIWMCQGWIVNHWELGSPVALWITMFTVLFSLLTPMLAGVLQGCQDFFWLGWSNILGGACRLGGAAVLVLAFGMGAAGMMTGALVGMLIGVIIGVSQTRGLWSLKRESFDGKNLLKQIVPLSLGFGACQFMFTSDTIFAKAHFTGDEMAPYVAAGTLSRGLLWLVLPLAAVMFPKLVHSHAKAEKNNLLGIVLAGTAVLAVCGGFGLWLVGPLVIKVVFKTAWMGSAIALLPWYAAAMVPLALANVLANDLLARGRFRAVPFMVLLAIAYGFGLPYVLTHYPKKLEHVLQTLAAANFLLLCVCAWAAFGKRSKSPSPAAAV